MSDYKAPLEDIMHLFEHVIGLEGLPQMDELSAEDIGFVLENAAQLAAGVIAPLNQSGDQEGCHWSAEGVTTPAGFKEAYAEYQQGGWNSVPFTPDYGGQGLPWLVAFALQEMWLSANLSFGLCPLLNQGAVEAVSQHGSEEQKNIYLEKLISGEWTGTMNLTEPEAGSDLAAVKTKAEPQDDGSYLVKGQKIFISFGEHDFVPNIIHLVLARTPDAPAGVKGISLFIVPKFIPNDNGALGQRNDVKCVSIEHKMGIHASPTCTMQFGEEGGAVGYLVGEENQGLKYMFTMMNNARLAVGLQGVAVAERSFQHALDFAKERKQGASLTDKSGEKVAIIEHADVKRMLLMMKAYIAAGRALAYEAARCLDLAQEDQAAQDKVDLLTPIVKAWCTDMAETVTSLGIQVFGGMGYVEESGAAQYYRDARILSIYEGTNGIQALDLSFRKVVMNGGTFVEAWLAEARGTCDGDDLDAAFTALEEATSYIVKTGAENPEAVAAVNVHYLQAFGLIAGAVMLCRSARASRAQQDIYDVYMDYILPQYIGYLEAVHAGGSSVLKADI